MRFRSILLLLLLSHSNTQANEQNLECRGSLMDEGINLPKENPPFTRMREDAYQQYVVDEKSITVVSGSADIKNDRIQLCKKAGGFYTYAWDCSVEEPRRMAFDWTEDAAVELINSTFAKKWLLKPTSYLGAKVIYLDRINLLITDDQYQLLSTTRTIMRSGAKELKLINYAVIRHQIYGCKIAKPKL